MEFFDKLGKKATEAYKVTADKTGKIAKETKYKLKISDLRSQINTLFSEIGKKEYEKYTLKKSNAKDDQNISDEIQEKCIKIETLNDEIDDLTKKCLELNNKRKCSNCGKEIENDVKFCPHCGTEQIIEIEKVEEVETETNETDSDSEKEETKSDEAKESKDDNEENNEVKEETKSDNENENTEKTEESENKDENKSEESSEKSDENQ